MDDQLQDILNEKLTNQMIKRGV